MTTPAFTYAPQGITRYTPPELDDMRTALVSWPDPQFMQAMSAAATFIRRNRSRRYSDTTVVKLATIADPNADTSHWKAMREETSIIVAERPYLFDEDTESKAGGLDGVLVVIPGGESVNRTGYLCVHPNVREKGVAQALLKTMNWYGIEAEFPVHATNVIGQRTLLKQGLVPAEMSSSGVLKFRPAWAASTSRRENDSVW